MERVPLLFLFLLISSLPLSSFLEAKTRLANESKNTSKTPPSSAFKMAMVLNMNQSRETGRKAQLGNIQAAKSVADIIRSTLGPRAMLKMLLDPMGIVMTNDGNNFVIRVGT